MTKSFIIEPLTANHKRDEFDCGIESLNDFLKRFARQNNEKGLGRTYAAVTPGDSQVFGYYTIASGAVNFDTIPEKIPRYPVPVVHLGRLGVDKRFQGQSLGKVLLADALTRAVRIADQLGIYAVEVNALTHTAREFYLRFGFIELLDDRLHLYMPIKKVLKLMP